jgi:hypothetical protein
MAPISNCCSIIPPRRPLPTASARLAAPAWRTVPRGEASPYAPRCRGCATTLFASGCYLDRIDVTATPFRFKERIVVLDSDKIDTLLAIPI